MKNYYEIRISITLTIVFIGLLVTNSAVIAQSENQTRDKAPVLEVFGDEYVPSLRENHPTSPAYKFSTPGFFTVQVNVNEQGENIVGDAANEPSIAFDPTDPNKIAIGWRQFDNINNNFRQAGIGFSTDAGETWTFPGVINPGVFRSDPVLDSDKEGNFYYNSLTATEEDYWCDVYKSEDGGESWDNGTYAFGGDKQWMTIDKSGGDGSGNIYAFWNSYYSICEPDHFTRSVDGGGSFEDCISVPGYPIWGTTVVSGEGELYVCGLVWGENFIVAKSSTAQNAGQPVIWDFSTSIDLNGELVGFGGYDCPNPSGLLGQTIITVDSSGGPSHGNVYLLASVDPYTGQDPLDVMFTRSTDGGLTWSLPIKVNDDIGTNAYQWLGTMSVAPDGRIDVVWLDTRDNPGTVWSVLYYSYSLDAGNTWSENTPLTEAFDPHVGWPQQEKMGDYFDMYSDETGAHLAWANTFNGEQDVYYAYITPSTVGISNSRIQQDVVLYQNYPNPVRNSTVIRYRLAAKAHVSLKVFDMMGREVAVLVNEVQQAGISQVDFIVDDLENGVYYYRLDAGNYSETKKLLIID
ncbi:MAG: hypothetical protein B6D61_13680 [Bacteroidetes bacterium 4484_249]|nr:MAG: hypothetical protein B6D61_13680 [Bacteroidetes bacterium 4484_249]